MRKLKKLLVSPETGNITFWCIGCDTGHSVSVGEGVGPRWGFNKDMDKPTFTPSVLVTYDGKDADTPDGIPSVCHSFVTNGKIQYLGDSSHALANQEIDLPEAF